MNDVSHSINLSRQWHGAIVDGSQLEQCLACKCLNDLVQFVEIGKRSDLPFDTQSLLAGVGRSKTKLSEALASANPQQNELGEYESPNLLLCRVFGSPPNLDSRSKTLIRIRSTSKDGPLMSQWMASLNGTTVPFSTQKDMATLDVTDLLNRTSKKNLLSISLRLSDDGDIPDNVQMVIVG